MCLKEVAIIDATSDIMSEMTSDIKFGHMSVMKSDVKLEIMSEMTSDIRYQNLATCQK